MDMLIFVEGSQKGQRYPLEQARLSIGRDRHNDIPLDDSGSSRNHAVVERNAEGLFVRDLGSTNGTFLNSRRIANRSALKNGDRIGIGDTVILIETAQVAAAPKVLVSDSFHEGGANITVEMDSTVLLSPSSLAAMNDEVQQQILSLFNFTARITGVLDMDRLLPLALGEMARAVKADRGAILFLNKAEELTAKQTFPEGSDDVVISRTVTESVLGSRQGLLSNPGKGNPQLRDTVSISRRDVGSVICAPLLIEDRVLGVAYLDTRTGSRNFTERSLHMLSAMAMQLAIAIQNAHLYRSLRNSEEFASCILKSIGSGLFVEDARGVVIRANDAACQILDLTQKDFVGVPLATLPQLRELAAMVEQTRSSGIPLDRGELGVRVGERDVPLGVSTSVLEDFTGKATGVVCTFRDLTRLKKLADEVKRSQRLASLGEMAAGIAHEVRNPLNSVYGFAQLLQESAAKRGDQSDIEYSQIVLEEVTRINKIVQDMLDFSRQRDVTMTSLRLAELLAGLERQLRPDAAAAGVEISVNAGAASPVIMGNADRLKQLFMNVMQNACQACARGGRVRISLEAARNPQNVYPEAVVRIKDDGCGIPRETLDKIFNPFFTTKDIGTGLGLPICQKIAEQHAGRIEVESEPGLGSTFSIFLPMCEEKPHA